MDRNAELLPFFDPQQQTVELTFCTVCGREKYAAEGQCIYCARFCP